VFTERKEHLVEEVASRLDRGRFSQKGEGMSK
jgi:hypothetical protein